MGDDVLRLKKLVGELRELERIIDGYLRHSPLMRQVSGNFDAREVLRLSNELELRAGELEQYITLASKEAQGLSQRMGNRPPQSFGPGRFARSHGGELAELRTLSSRLPRKVLQLQQETKKLRSRSMQGVNDPRRWGSPPDPTHGLLPLVVQVIEIISSLVRRGRRE